MRVNKEILNPLRAENIPLHQMSTDSLINLARDKESSRRDELAVFVCTRADAYDELGRPYPVWLSACLFELSDKLEEIAKEAARELRAQNKPLIDLIDQLSESVEFPGENYHV